MNLLTLDIETHCQRRERREEGLSNGSKLKYVTQVCFEKWGQGTIKQKFIIISRLTFQVFTQNKLYNKQANY